MVEKEERGKCGEEEERKEGILRGRKREVNVVGMGEGVA